MAALRRPKAAAAKSGPGPKHCQASHVQKAVDVCLLLRLRDRMKQQLHDCSNAIVSDQISCLDHIVDEHFSKGAAEDLERVMEHFILHFQNKTLALQRVQLGFHLKSKVKQHDYESQLIIGSMKHVTMLSRTVVEYQQRAREKERKLIDIKRKRFSLKKSGEQKMLQIHAITRKVKEKQGRAKVIIMLDTIRRSIQKERHRIAVLQNVFQNIVIGSKVNWARNPSLKSFVLQLEKNVSSV